MKFFLNVNEPLRVWGIYYEIDRYLCEIAKLCTVVKVIIFNQFALQGNSLLVIV